MLVATPRPNRSKEKTSSSYSSGGATWRWEQIGVANAGHVKHGTCVSPGQFYTFCWDIFYTTTLTTTTTYRIFSKVHPLAQVKKVISHFPFQFQIED
jgi:hypothetical protein